MLFLAIFDFLIFSCQTGTWWNCGIHIPAGATVFEFPANRSYLRFVVAEQMWKLSAPAGAIYNEVSDMHWRLRSMENRTIEKLKIEM